MEPLRREVSFRVDPAPLINRALKDRIDAIVEHYRAMCLSREYRAALNLWIGIDQDSALFGELRKQTHGGQEDTAEDWQAILQDLDIEPTALRGSMRIVMASNLGVEER